MNQEGIEIKITMSEQLNELFGALSKAQGKIQGAAKDKANPFFKSKYADLSSVWDACRQPLSENGISVIQMPQTKGDVIYLMSILGHASGQWIKGEVEIPIAKKDPQTIGSAITYFRRYVLSAMVGVAPDDDDDGEKAQQAFRTNGTQTKPPVPPVVPKLNQNQVEELNFILEECDDKYQEWFYDHINKQYKTKNIAELPSDIYVRMKDACTKNMETTRSKQRELVGAEVQ